MILFRLFISFNYVIYQWFFLVFGAPINLINRWCRCSSECTIINKKQKQQKCIYYLECGVMCRSHKKFQEEWGSTHCQRKMHILQCACQHLQIHRCQIWNLFYNIYCAIGIILSYIQHKFIIYYWFKYYSSYTPSTYSIIKL